MPIERIIGIDFGTSTSVVKIKSYKDNIPMESKDMSDYVRFDNKDSLPTLVYKTVEDTCLVGYEAVNAAVKGTLYQNFKLDLVSEDEQLRKEAIELTKIFFNYLYKTYNEQSSYFPSCHKESTYISYPAKWPKELINLMVEIAKEEGFKNVTGIDEPTAAMYAVMILEIEKLQDSGLVKYGDNANILMIDMGAGTTDLALCKYKFDNEHRVEIINTWPKAGDKILFGGREIDIILCDYIKKYLIECGLPSTKNFNEKYMDKCKAWKESNLSPIFKNSDGVVKYCGFIDTLLGMLGVDNDFPPMDRKDFESLIKEYMEQYPQLINGCMKASEEKYGFKSSDLDFIILTGGHSQWYFVNDILEGRLNKYGEVKLPKIQSHPQSVIRLSRPQETVALGLVYQRLAITVRKPEGSSESTDIGSGSGSASTSGDVSKKGFTTGNITNRALAVQHEDFIYYKNQFPDKKWGDGCIFKIHKHGREGIKLVGEVCDYFDVVQDWVYYVTSKTYAISKVRIDGSQKTQLMASQPKPVNFIKVVDDWVYYKYNLDELYRMRTDGREKTLLETSGCDFPNIVDGWIYYRRSKENGKLYKMRTDGSSKTKLYNYNCYHINVENGWIYFTDGGNDRLYKIRTDGCALTKLSNVPCFWINVVDGWIYFRKGQAYNSWYKMRTDGSSLTMLSNDSIFCLNIAGDWIYYMAVTKKNKSGPDETELYRMRINGTDKERVI